MAIVRGYFSFKSFPYISIITFFRVDYNILW